MSTTTDVTMLVEYSVTDAAIATLCERFNHLEIAPGDTKSYEIIRLSIAEVRAIRVGVEKERKALKENALKYGQRVDGEAKRITLELREIEDSLKEKKAVVDDEKARIKEVAETKERERTDRIKLMISAIERRGEGLTNVESLAIKEAIDSVNCVVVNAVTFFEFTEDAERAKARVLESLQARLEEREHFESERARVEVAREQLEKQRIEQQIKLAEERSIAAERERRVAAEREQAEAENKIAQEKIDAENKKIAEAKEALDRERFRLQAEKEAKENAIREAKEREAKAVAARLAAETKAKQEAERAPDKQKVRVYLDDILGVLLSPPEIKDRGLRESMVKFREAMADCIHNEMAAIDSE